MLKRRLGTSGLHVSRIALGTMTWGRDTDEHEAANQLRSFLDAGGNLIDSAAIYGDGDSERVIGGFIGTLVSREELIIATKAGISFKDGQRKVDNSRASLLSDLDRSLSRLGVDTVDLWQIHAYDDETRIEETLSALDYAVASGRVRYVGVSNFNGWQSARAVTIQNPFLGKVAISSLQNEYSLLNRQVENEVLPAAQEMGVGFLAWSPLGRGVLTGKYQEGMPIDSRGASQHFASFIAPYLNKRARTITQAVMVAADGLGLSPLEVAVAWIRDRKGVSASIVGARTGAQLKGILRSEEVEIPAQVSSALDEVSSQSEVGD
ncbi:MAG: aldo/keto reductase [Candidatus Nanopelagicaceae bacterium]